MEGFNGPELVLGSIYGVRHFSWRGGHGLSGVSHQFPWEAEENEAVCFATSGRKPKSWKRAKWCIETHGEDHNEEKMKAVSAWLGVAPLELEMACLEVDEWEDTHTPGDPACGCGFWAYYGEGLDSPYAGQNRIAGVIEGYGRTTLGTKGFRCEKAKIVALMVPLPAKPKEPEPKAEPYDQSTAFEDEYQHHKARWWSLRSHREVKDILRARATHTSTECEAGPVSHGRHDMLCYPRGQKDGFFGRTYRDYSEREQEVIRRQAAAPSITPKGGWSSTLLTQIFTSSLYPWASNQECVPVESVSALYPDVPIFHSMDDMLREFPTERPDFTENVA